MQIELCIKVSKIAAFTHAGAKEAAFDHLAKIAASSLLSVGIDLDEGYSPAMEQFAAMSKSYREADGTFTVTIP